MMNRDGLAIFSLLLLMFSLSCGNKEKEVSLNVYDLVNMMPVDYEVISDSIVVETLELGRTGLDRICSQVVSPGKGNDSRY